MVWVDPLDGTAEYTQGNWQHSAVMLFYDFVLTENSKLEQEMMMSLRLYSLLAHKVRLLNQMSHFFLGRTLGLSMTFTLFSFSPPIFCRPLIGCV